MFTENATLISEIRERFAHVDSCPFQGQRIFFENAGGALTLKSVVETSAFYAAIPDNPGRQNPAGQRTQKVINKAKNDLGLLMNATSGQFFVGESGTELLFRMIRTACLAAPKHSKVIGSSIEHPASRSAARRWAKITEMDYINVVHDNATGMVTAEDYSALMTPDVAVATILHASPVTGIGMDVKEIVIAIRSVSPNCYIIVDGIQHAAHGQIDLQAYNVDGYAISPYKMFSRHGYGIAWISERLAKTPHDKLIDAPITSWEFGTRDTGSYATISDIVSYFEWLGSKISQETDRRSLIKAAGEAIHSYETSLTDCLINGTGNLRGLRELDGITILAGDDNPKREGLISIVIKGRKSEDIVEELNVQGIRTHTRKADYYSGNVLSPLNQTDCVRISLCHYNTEAEIRKLLTALAEIVKVKSSVQL
ncbi:MAG: aminotransferase class V-fold PLP-dependent enzyme [Aestuariivita sp.]|nr:aminotransferase class V-fold PLP-dependent enzyme [Aestuariivita sp.]